MLPRSARSAFPGSRRSSLNVPVHIDYLASVRNWDQQRYGISYWLKYTIEHNLPHSEENPLKWIHPSTQEYLQNGWTVSEKDIQARWLREQGHLADDDLLKFSFDLNSVTMDPDALQPSMIVEFQDHPHKDVPQLGPFPGRVLGLEKDPQDGTTIVLLESFEPVPALLAPKSIAPWMIDPSYVPNKTWAIGYGTYKAMTKKRVKIPMGMFDPQDAAKRVYFLDQPMPLSKIQSFCEKHYPKNPECVWQSMVFLVLPIHAAADLKGRHNGGIFRPYPDDLQTTEIEAQIDWFSEGMEFEE